MGRWATCLREVVWGDQTSANMGCDSLTRFSAGAVSPPQSRESKEAGPLLGLTSSLKAVEGRERAGRREVHYEVVLRVIFKAPGDSDL